MSKARRQIGDQSTKGAALGLCVYGMVKGNFDPMLIALLVPVISTVFAWISTKIGDPELACLFIDNLINEIYCRHCTSSGQRVTRHERIC